MIDTLLDFQANGVPCPPCGARHEGAKMYVFGEAGKAWFTVCPNNGRLLIVNLGDRSVVPIDNRQVPEHLLC